jgi:hypothetical protein
MAANADAANAANAAATTTFRAITTEFISFEKSFDV